MPFEDITRSHLASGKVPLAYRNAEVVHDSIDEEARTVEISFSSEYPVERWDWVEVLGHSEGEVDLSRLLDGAPFLFNHNWSDQRGVIVDARIESGKGYATVKLSRNPLGEQLFTDMKDGIARNISVGYRIQEAELTKRENNFEHWRVTRWLPLEISTAPVPADPTIGLGRADTDQHNPVKLRGNSSMDEDENTTENTTETTASERSSENPAPAKPQVRTQESKPPVNHAKRIAEAGEQYGAIELANKFIREGGTYDQFNKALMDELHTKRNDSTAESTALDLGLEEKDLRRYSLISAIRGAATGNWKNAGLERSVSQAIAERAGKDPEGIFLSYEALGYGLRNQLKNNMQRLQSAGGTGVGAELVATELHSELFIEVLRSQSVLGGLGARVMTGLVGDVDIPKQAGSATFYWVAEDGSATDSDVSFSIVQLRPKTIAAAVPITRRLMIQSTPSIENLVRSDIMEGLALGLDNAGLVGTGLSNQPLGVRNTSGIGAVDITGGVNWAKIVELETDTAEANANAATSAYLMRPSMRGTLKTTEKATNTGQFIYSGGDVNGYRAEVTTQMAASEILFGDFSQVMMGMWGALDIVPDRSTKAASGGLVMRVFQDADVALRHAQAFSLAEIP